MAGAIIPLQADPLALSIISPTAAVTSGPFADYDSFAPALAYLESGLSTGALLGFRLSECGGECVFGQWPVASAFPIDGYGFTLVLFPAAGAPIVRGPYPSIDYAIPQLPELRGDLRARTITGFELSRAVQSEAWPGKPAEPAQAAEPQTWLLAAVTACAAVLWRGSFTKRH